MPQRRQSCRQYLRGAGKGRSVLVGEDVRLIDAKQDRASPTPPPEIHCKERFRVGLKGQLLGPEPTAARRQITSTKH